MRYNFDMDSTRFHLPLTLAEAAALSPPQIIDPDQTRVAISRGLGAVKRQLFGQKSEKRLIEADGLQLSLGDALWEAQSAVPPSVPEKVVATHARRIAVRNPGADAESESVAFFFDESRVPVEVTEVANPDTEGLASDEFEIVGHKESYRLAQRPGSHVVLKYARPVIKHLDTEVISCPGAPVGVIDGSGADVSFIAGLLIDKMADHLPLYRQYLRLIDAGFKAMADFVGPTRCCAAGAGLQYPVRFDPGLARQSRGRDADQGRTERAGQDEQRLRPLCRKDRTHPCPVPGAHPAQVF